MPVARATAETPHHPTAIASAGKKRAHPPFLEAKKRGHPPFLDTGPGARKGVILHFWTQGRRSRARKGVILHFWTQGRRSSSSQELLHGAARFDHVVSSVPAAGCLRGRPRERSVCSRPNSLAARPAHRGEPKGLPRFTLLRTASSSALGMGRLTRASQSAGRGTGHSSRSSSGSPANRSERLDHFQSQDLSTFFARSGLASTYRSTSSRCSSRCTGNALKRPWYRCPP